jgi:poly(A) polymerase
MTVPVLISAGFSAYLHGYSAIDSWLSSDAKQKVNSHTMQVFTNASIADLARLFEDLSFPGVDLADASLVTTAASWLFHCADYIETVESAVNLNFGLTEKKTLFPKLSQFTLLDFFQDYSTGVFHDPHGIYPVLREIKQGNCDPFELFKNGLYGKPTQALMDAALILAKYFPQTDKLDRRICEIFNNVNENFTPGVLQQRLLLSQLMISDNPGLGLELLKTSGFIEKFWPELAILDEVDHAKEFHPEGNAWRHTMETFHYRKTGKMSETHYVQKNRLRPGAFDLCLSLGLLLHDTGKPIAMSAGSRRFDGHAELGEAQTRRFLTRLDFDSALIHDVCFLVRNHMLPAALPRLPLYRTEEIMSSELFPVLLELYRCDESSSFKGLDRYYESSAAYRQFLRNRRNPYRSADGKVLTTIP